MITQQAKADLANSIASKTTDQLWLRATKLIRENESQSTEFTAIGGNGAWSVSRKHKKFIEQIMDNLEVPFDSKAAIVGGMPGAGKSRMLPAFFDPAEYFVVDPDDIKAWLVQNDLYVDIEGLTPMETGPLLHVESTVLAKKLSEALLTAKANIIWPLTFSNEDPVNNRFNMATKAGYDVAGAYVTVSMETSTARVKARYDEGMRAFASGSGLGGRFIDLERVKRNSNPALFMKYAPKFSRSRVLNNDMDLI